MRKEGNTYYYTDKMNEDCNDMNPVYPLTIDKNYNYLPKCWLRIAFNFFVTYFLIIPIMFCYTKIFLGVKVYGKKNRKALKKMGYVMYSNHTCDLDCVVATVNINFPIRTNHLAYKYPLQLPFVRHLVKILGIMPIADTFEAQKNFQKALSQIFAKKHALTIYPEAHIWKYYTGLRNFAVSSFKIPAMHNVPVLPVAVTYKQRKLFKKAKPKMIIYIGQPVFPNPEFKTLENAEYLRNEVYNFISSKVEDPSNYAYYKYLPETK